MKKRLLSACFLLSSVAVAAPDEGINALRIHGKSGESVTILLDERPVVRFEGNDLVVATHMNVVSFPSADVVRFTYASVDPEGVRAPGVPGMACSFEKDFVRMANLSPRTRVSVYTADGRLVSSAMTDGGGRVSLKLPERSASVYVVKTSSATFKIARP